MQQLTAPFLNLMPLLQSLDPPSASWAVRSKAGAIKCSKRNKNFCHAKRVSKHFIFRIPSPLKSIKICPNISCFHWFRAILKKDMISSLTAPKMQFGQSCWKASLALCPGSVNSLHPTQLYQNVLMKRRVCCHLKHFKR